MTSTNAMKWKGFKRTLAWILTAMMIVSGNGTLTAFAGSRSDVLSYRDGELTVNTDAALQASERNWENAAAKAADLDALPDQLTDALEDYTICEVRSDLEKDVIFIVAYKESRNAAEANTTPLDFLIVGLNTSSEEFRAAVVVESDGQSLNLDSAETFTVMDRLPEVYPPVPETTPQALNLPQVPAPLPAEDAVSDPAIESPADGQPGEPDQLNDPDQTNDSVQTNDSDPNDTATDQGGQDASDSQQPDSDMNPDQQPSGGGNENQTQNPSSENEAGQPQGGSENTGDGQADDSSQNTDSDGNSGASQAAPSTQNLVGSATNSLRALKALYGAAPAAPKTNGAPEFKIASDSAESFAFTVVLPAAPAKKEIKISQEKVSLYGKDQNPGSDAPLDIPAEGIDPQLVYGLKYECFLQKDVSLADAAGESMVVDLKDFAGVFKLGELGAEGTVQTMSITVEGTAVVLGHITLDSKAATATISYLDAPTLQTNLEAAVSDAKIEDVKELSAAYWLSCSFDSQGNHDTTKTHVTIGDQEIKLDWSKLPSNETACAIKKTAGDYDGNTQTLLWNIKLTPSNGASLAAALFTDVLSDDLSFDPTAEGAFIISQGRTSHSIVNNNDNNPLSVKNSTLAYQFPSDSQALAGIDLTKELTVTVKTTVKDRFFTSHLGTKASITNTASIENQGQDGGFPRKESEAERTFSAGWFSKTGEKYSGAHADEIGWNINLKAPVQMKEVLIYDLLPVQLTANRASDGALTLGQVIWQGKTLTTDQNEADWYQVTTVQKDEINDDYPAGLNTEIKNMLAGRTRYLVTFHLSSVPAGSHSVKFYAPLALGGMTGNNLKIQNKAYLKADSIGIGDGSGGWVGGQQGSASATVDYTQAAIEKTGSYSRSNHHLTWKISVNNNRSSLTGGVKITDDLTKPLKTPGWEADFDPAADLTWWTDDSAGTAVTMAAMATAPSDVSKYPDLPQYTFDKNVLTIYVKEMSGKTYHFKIDTEIVGEKAYTSFYHENAVKNNTGNQGNSTTISNSATLRFDNKNVTADAKVSVISKFLAKEAYGYTSGKNTGVPYDPADNSFWWKIQLNADQRPMAGTVEGTGGPTITDDLPEGFSYLDYELYSVSRYDTSHYMYLGKLLETGATDRQAARLVVSDEGSQVKFIFKEPVAEGYILFVKTKIDPTKIEADKTFKNECTVSFYENGKACSAEASNISKIGIDGVSKTGEQVFESGKAVYEARWTMDVNRDGLANGFESPVLTDVLPEGCTLQKNPDGTYNVSIKKLKVTAALSNRTTVVGSAQTVGDELAETLAAYWDYDEATRTFTFRLPSDVPDTLQYSAYRVVLITDIGADKAGTTMKNSASYTGIRVDENASSDDVKVYFFGVAAGGIWNKPEDKTKTVRIVKVSSEADDHGVKPALQGAQFELSFTLNGSQVIWKATTGADGKAVIHGIPSGASNMTLTEVKAPGGYVLPNNPVVTVDFKDNTLEIELEIENDPADEPGPGPNPGPNPDPKPHPDRDHPDRTPVPKDPDVILPDEEIPAGQLPDDETDAVITIPDEELPAGPAEITSVSVLPKTGGLSADILYAAGSLLIGLGALVRMLERRRSH